MLASKVTDKASLAAMLTTGQGGVPCQDWNELAGLPQAHSSLPPPDALLEAAKLREEKRKEKAARKAAEINKAMEGLKKLEDEGIQDDNEVRF